ncbi:ATP-dependent helicase/nuclease subunit B [Candidatus Termititenax aidoneus]|uniref:ATP-dependent helicase/nuclease subunit B n=1 Tax=Termititenax aidoneus TaxID=2218524 RepID=A0A388TCP4_TERA1|nr:ATP-dependent helicase/nuclease subunit B [Candidatus Termititenax aidoneus]
MKKENPLRRDIYFLVPTEEHAERIKDLVLEKLAGQCLAAGNIQTLDSFIYQGDYISELKKQLLLQKICAGLDLSKYFKPETNSALLANPDFFAALSDLISELKTYRVFGKNFLDKLPNPDKKAELEKIFAAYQAELAAQKLPDKEDSAKNFQPPEHCAVIFIDGFTEFTPLQFEIIQRLGTDGRRLVVTLPLGAPDNKLFMPTQKTAAKFKALGFQTAALEKSWRSPDQILQALALHWGEKLPSAKNTADLPECGGVKILAAGNRLQEIEAIAREILAQKKAAQAKQAQFHWSDTALIFRRIGNYQFLINEVFQRYGIPVEIHEGINLRNQFIEWLLSLRDVLAGEQDENSDASVNSETLLALLKSAYAKHDQQPLDPEAVTALETALSFQPTIKEVLAVCDRRLADYLPEVFALSAKLRAAQNFSQIKETLAEFYKFNACRAALEADLEIPELETGVTHVNRAYSRLLEILDELQEIQPSWLAADELWPRLLYSLRELTAARKRNGDQVQVYDAPSARQKDYKIVFLADLTSNSFPARAAESALLKDYEKAELGSTELKLTGAKILNENLFFYQMLTRAQEKLYLSYADREASGGVLKPSHFLAELQNFTAQKFGQKIARAYYTYAQLFSEAEPLCRSEYERLYIYRAYLEKWQTARANLSLADIPENQRETDLRFLTEVVRRKNDPKNLRQAVENTAQELQKLKKFSAKGLETFSRCAFRYFCEQVLNLRTYQPPSHYDADYPAILGTIQHETLAAYYNPANPRRPLEEIYCQLYPPQKFQEQFPNMPRRQAELEQQKTLAILKNFVELDENLQKERRAAVLHCEYEFRQNPKTGADRRYPIDDNFISGVIDRIDKIGENFFLILDYKPGALPPISAKSLDQKILPQAWLYALLYQSATGLQAAGAEYVRLKNNERRGIYLKEPNVFSKGISAAEITNLFEKTQNLIREHFAALQSGNFYQNHDNTFCRKCPAEEVCRKKQTKIRFGA